MKFVNLFKLIFPNIKALGKVILYLACWLLLLGALGLLLAKLQAVLGQWNINPNIEAEVEMLLTALVVTFLFMRFIDHRPMSDLGLSCRGRGGEFLAGMVTAMAVYVVGFAASLAMGMIRIVSVQVNIKVLIISFVIFLLVAFVEEILFRGYILGSLLCSKVNRFVALAESAILFSALHMGNSGITNFCLFNLFVAGLMLGICYIYTRNLWFSIALHIFWNWIQGPVMGYEVSGNDFGQSLLKLSFSDGSSVWSGARFGFEGTPQCTILMVLFIIIAVAYYEGRRGRRQIS